MKNWFLFIIVLMSIANVAFADLSLDQLGFKEEDLKLDPELTKIMNERHSKLGLHQKFAIATAVAMTTTMLLSEGAKDNVSAHRAAGITSGLLYWTTAYLAWSAPKPDSIKDTGSTRIHKSLSFVHMPLMALAPVLGYLHHQNDKKAKASTGLVKSHGGIASAAYFTFLAAGLTMYFDF